MCVLLLQDTREILQLSGLWIFFFLKKPILLLYSISIGRIQNKIIAKKKKGETCNELLPCGKDRWKPGYPKDWVTPQASSK